jgi:glycosyltransferase involved in cell wall biosynthesis
MSTSVRFPIIELLEPVSILMPVCNEADVIEEVVEEWVREVISHLPVGSELLFDEAASTDGTRDILRRLGTKYPFISTEYHDKKDGFANAARRLYERANCPWVFFTDSDGQYVASDFWKLAKHIADRYELIRGAKIGRKDPIFRRLASAIFNKIIQFLFNINYLDFNSAFFLIRRDALRDILGHLNCMPTLINTELLLRVELENYSIKQVYVLHRMRMFGVSRGLEPSTFIQHSFKALKGLYAIKSSYRTRNQLHASH